MTIDPTVHAKLDEIRVVLEAILTELRKKRQLPDEVTQQHIPTPPPDYIPPSYVKMFAAYQKGRQSGAMR